MPRDGSGVAERLPNTSAVAGQTIESADFEASMNDIYSILNSPVPAVYIPSISALGAVAKSGDTMTGLLTLSGDATASLHAVTKQQMDTAIATRAATSHTHTASQVTDFSTAADARVAAASINALSDVTITSAADGQMLKRVGGVWVNYTPYTEYNLGSLSTLGVGASKKTQAHGLGVRPSNVAVLFRCRVASNGFSVGDEGPLNNVLNNSVSTGAHAYWNATNVVVSGYGDYYVVNPSGSNVPITASNFDLIIRVFA